jgi:MFS family permease
VSSKRGSDSLGSRFWTLWFAFSASNLGDGLSIVGFPLLAISLTDDARLVAAVAATRFLPFLVIGLPAGVLIDRFDRRKIAMVAQGIRAIAVLTVALAISADSATIALLMVAAFVVGSGEVLTDGGLPAVVRDVVETRQLEVANSRLRASETVSNQFVGPPVGALLFQLSPAAVFFATSAIYASTILVLAALPGSFIPEQTESEDSFFTKMRSGVVYVWQHPVLRPLAFAVAAFSFAGSAHHDMFVLLATEHFGLSEVQYGMLLAAGSVTAVLTSFFVARLVQRTSHSWSMRISVATFAIHTFLFGAFTFIPIVVFAALLGGVADPTWNVISGTVRQRLVDDRIFGRMMTAYLLIAWSLKPVGTMVGGIIAESFGVRFVPLMAGVIIGSLLIFARPMFRRIDTAMAEA